MDFLSSSFNLELVLRLVLAVIFGGLIGLEREFAKKTAGLKTFALVSLGSSLFTIISILVFQFVSDIVPKNPLQLVTIPAAAVSGIGFIGAGLIIFHGSHVRGITTAAGLWVSAAVGMAVGFGFYEIAGFATFLTVIIFVLFWIIEEKLIRKLNVLNKDEKQP
ncbi:MAG: MgtC/SapB family protein [Patescibacteria group bacterium]